MYIFRDSKPYRIFYIETCLTVKDFPKELQFHNGRRQDRRKRNWSWSNSLPADVVDPVHRAVRQKEIKLEKKSVVQSIIYLFSRSSINIKILQVDGTWMKCCENVNFQSSKEKQHRLFNLQAFKWNFYTFQVQLLGLLD